MSNRQPTAAEEILEQLLGHALNPDFWMTDTDDPRLMVLTPVFGTNRMNDALAALERVVVEQVIGEDVPAIHIATAAQNALRKEQRAAVRAVFRGQTT